MVGTWNSHRFKAVPNENTGVFCKSSNQGWMDGWKVFSGNDGVTRQICGEIQLELSLPFELSLPLKGKICTVLDMPIARIAWRIERKPLQVLREQNGFRNFAWTNSPKSITYAL